MSIKEHPPHLHVPVLLETMLKMIQPAPNESYLDLTAGYGGHAAAFLEKTKNYSESVLVDRDEFAITQLATFKEKGVRLISTDFLSAAQMLQKEGRKFSLVLVDLGVSSPQLDRAERGFSFTNSGPLDMRMDRRQEQTAADLVNSLPEAELKRIIIDYGEEHRAFAHRIARTVIRNRPLHTTKELADLILQEHRGKWQRTHPATRTFQALRIALNDELGQIAKTLPILPDLLLPGGRLGIISFHSLEDRLIKRFFKEQAAAGYEAELSIVTKKPISGATEDAHNPRSRSAKLRIAVKK